MFFFFYRTPPAPKVLSDDNVSNDVFSQVLFYCLHFYNSKGNEKRNKKLGQKPPFPGFYFQSISISQWLKAGIPNTSITIDK